MRNARNRLTYQHGWIAVFAVVGAFEVACPKGHTLSEGADVFLARHPIGGRLAIAAVALHMSNVFTDLHIDHLDVIHQVARVLGK